MGGFGAGPPMARPGMPPPGEPESVIKLWVGILDVKVTGRKDGPMGGFGAGPPMGRPGMPPPGDLKTGVQNTA